MSFFAVLMGDLVDSEDHGDTRYLHSAFNSAIERQKSLLADDMASPLTITLGDEFQGLLHSLDAAAKVARNIRFDLMLHDIDCRFVIGIVDIKTPLNPERAWNMMGPGLAAARERLGEKRSSNRYRFSIPQDALLETLLEAIGGSLSAIERKWSRVQRDVIITLSEDVSVAELAQARDVGIANIYKVRSAGDYDRYRTEWDAVHTALAELDLRYGLVEAD